MSRATGFLEVPRTTPAVQHLYDEDEDDLGYVMNLTRVWAHEPEAITRLFDLLGTVSRAGSLTVRQRGVLVAATASTIGDSYCSLAWGDKLAHESDAALAAGVLRGDDRGLDAAELALARWARRVAGDANGTTPEDLAPLREAGFDDRQIFAITTFVALRIAFSTVNDALGVLPDRHLAETVSSQVRDAVGYGREPEG